ncbi:MAG: nuclear transport factor 2 family protein [Hyphomicrobiaceae bacterium]
MTGDRGGNRLEYRTRRVFEQAMTAWANQDLDRALRFVSDDIVHTLNVDGELVPFAASVKGKGAMREKLELMLETFEIGAYVTDHLSVQGHVVRANMKAVYIHLASGERLITKFRYVIEQRNGLMVRINEFHDAAYLEAFMVFIATSEKRRGRL